ncbi:MAG: electron transfer flavoprotein subunit alpha/FixB family protein, partial [Bacteroidales bacterium]|nr:electron transfer flavoprotein subunit alpha/FixB family protein [Bacteroidales bacterium]
MNKADYKGVYVFAEQRDGKIQSVALELLGKARVLADKLGEEVVAFFPGYKNTELAKELIAWGADKVIVMDAPELEHYLTEQYSQAMSQAIDKYKPSIVLLGATTIGRDLGPRLASRLATGL